MKPGKITFKKCPSPPREEELHPPPKVKSHREQRGGSDFKSKVFDTYCTYVISDALKKFKYEEVIKLNRQYSLLLVHPLFLNLTSVDLKFLADLLKSN